MFSSENRINISYQNIIIESISKTTVGCATEQYPIVSNVRNIIVSATRSLAFCTTRHNICADRFTFSNFCAAHVDCVLFLLPCSSYHILYYHYTRFAVAVNKLLLLLVIHSAWSTFLHKRKFNILLIV